MGLKFESIFVPKGKTAFEMVEWVKRDAVIHGPDGSEKFRQDAVEVPVFWSDRALAIVASKYFHGKEGTAQRETSVKQLIERVARTAMEWGLKDNYFDEENAEVFYQELCYLLVNQMASPNSPVWFNLGVYECPNISACYILAVEDNMESILEWQRQEAMIFKYGSGAGVNVSSLRSSKEFLSGGGRPSGPIPFMRATDTLAGSIKSGGAVRRSAKMVIMDIDHPDISTFIDCKIKSKEQEDALRAAGIFREIGDDSLNIPFSNSNHAVMITDDFMRCVEKDKIWELIGVANNEVIEEIPAKDLLKKIAEAVHVCGDPGVQFYDTINKWHTAANDGPILGSNPCSEVFWLVNSACNLVSLKLTAFLENGAFNTYKFQHAIDILISFQDIIIDKASYPTTKIKENSMFYRILGLGFTDLGAFLMKMGLPYDSNEGRNLAASIASFMTAEAYHQSLRLADVKSESWAVESNEEHLFNVFSAHRDHAYSLNGSLADNAATLWDELATDDGIRVRNMQVSLMQPSGTVSFMMDCDTTGIEPELALVKYKKMVGGGSMRIVSRAVEDSLKALSYKSTDIDRILAILEKKGNIEDVIDPKHLPVFDCAFRAEGSRRSIEPKAHLKMMAAIQPAISAAISKTVSLPSETTVDEIQSLIIDAHKMGIKSVTFYRDGCRSNQPLTTSQAEVAKKRKPIREKLPIEVPTIRHKFRVGNEDGYLHMGTYPDGTLGEIFINMSKEGSTMAGLMDTIATLTSISLQYGVPLETMVEKFSHTKFEPAGFTNNNEIPMAQSIIDYIFRLLGIRFAIVDNEVDEKPDTNGECVSSGGTCTNCGNTTVMIGRCMTCLVCGSVEGACS